MKVVKAQNITQKRHLSFTTTWQYWLGSIKVKLHVLSTISAGTGDLPCFAISMTPNRT